MMHKLRRIFLSILFSLIPAVVLAGDLEAPAAPTDPDSAMYTLTDIYNRLDNGTQGAKRTGPFAEPTSGLGATGYTLDEVMGKAPSVDDAAGAGVSEVLAGMTFWGLTGGTWGASTGTMLNVGQQTITPTTINRTITQGYHDGTGYAAGDANLSSGNIRQYQEYRDDFWCGGEPERGQHQQW